MAEKQFNGCDVCYRGIGFGSDEAESRCPRFRTCTFRRTQLTSSEVEEYRVASVKAVRARQEEMRGYDDGPDDLHEFMGWK
jgi:hypothetical protein